MKPSIANRNGPRSGADSPRLAPVPRISQNAFSCALDVNPELLVGADALTRWRGVITVRYDF